MPKPKRNINAVMDEMLSPPTTLPDQHCIARLKQAAGNNLYHLERSTGEAVLAELPSRFRSTIWLKRGMYVVVNTAALADRDNKLGGAIVNVVGDEKAWRKMPYWPVQFAAKKNSYDEDSEDEGPKMPESDSEGE